MVRCKLRIISILVRKINLHAHRNSEAPSPSQQLYFLRINILTGGADKSLARPTSRCILFDGKNISFGASLDIFINK